MDFTKQCAEYVKENPEKFEELISLIPEDCEITFSKDSDGVIYVYASGRI